MCELISYPMLMTENLEKLEKNKWKNLSASVVSFISYE